jgi:peptidase E
MNAPLFLLAGGRNIKGYDELLNRVRQSTGLAAPAVAYIGSASGDNTLFFGMMKKLLAQAGFGRVELAKSCAKKADLSRFKQIVTGADSVFISGGDVKAGMDVLSKKDLSGFLKDCHAAGKLFFGVSAGSIMLGSDWVFWEDEDDDSSARLFPCLGFVPFICDTHDDTDAWDELKTALRLTRPETMQTGYGLPAGSGLSVSTTGKIAALGCAVKCYTGRNGVVKQEQELLPARAG